MSHSVRSSPEVLHRPQPGPTHDKHVFERTRRPYSIPTPLPTGPTQISARKRVNDEDSYVPHEGRTSKQQKHGRTTKKRGHDASNVGLLTASSGYYEGPEDPELRARDRVEIQSTRRDDIIKQLFKGNNIKDVTQKDFKDATQAFPQSSMRGKVNSDGKPGWLLNTMKTPLQHHQLLGAGRMRRYETREKGPFGGILADAMGLGSRYRKSKVLHSRLRILTETIMMITVISGDLISLARKDAQDSDDTDDEDDLLSTKATLVDVNNRDLLNQCMLSSLTFRVETY